MKLNFNNLYKQMKESDSLRCQFTFTYNGVTADALFLTDVKPFLLIIGIVYTTDFIELNIEPGFHVSTFFPPDKYHVLCMGFHIEYNENHKFSPKDFLAFFNTKIPSVLKETKPVEPRHILQYKKILKNLTEYTFGVFVTIINSIIMYRI